MSILNLNVAEKLFDHGIPGLRLKAHGLFASLDIVGGFIGHPIRHGGDHDISDLVHIYTHDSKGPVVVHCDGPGHRYRVG